MKTMLAAGLAVLALLVAPHAAAEREPWCQWTSDLDTSQCGLVVGVPASGQLVSEPGDWSTPETRTKG